MLVNDLVKWDEIERQIDQAKDLKSIAQMQEQVKALKILAQQQDGSLRAGNRIDKYRFYLEQRAGEIYQKLPDDPGGRPKNSLSDLTSFSDKQEAEKETGKSRVTLNQWVKEAVIEKEVVEEYEATCNEKEKYFTSGGVMAFNRSLKEPEPIILPEDKYNLILVDPPWEYKGVQIHVKEAKDHYDEMSVEQLCEMADAIADICADNCTLFMWATGPHLEDAMTLLRAWGFQYKQNFVWIKR